MNEPHATSMEGAEELGRRLFQEEEQAWGEHLKSTPEDVGDLLQFFERLRAKAKEIDAAERGMKTISKLARMAWRGRAVGAFQKAAEASLSATIAEWAELSGREEETMQLVIEKWVPHSVQGLIFPNDPPACYWDARAFQLLQDGFQRVAQDIGLVMPDRAPPKHDLTPPSHLNRRERRAWHKINGKAAA